jgi:hypothetical protein
MPLGPLSTEKIVLAGHVERQGVHRKQPANAHWELGVRIASPLKTLFDQQT